MATEIGPHTFSRLFESLNLEVEARTKKALAATANLVERQAKINASSGAHKYGTPTPARPGTGPARISGTLVRSITHSPVRLAGHKELEVTVGTARGFYPSYGSGSRTPSSKYGLYLETVWNYPFLMPALKFVMGAPVRGVWKEAFGAGWRHLV